MRIPVKNGIITGMAGNIKTKKKRVVVAMSGGVDSSVAAALLAEQGHEVIGMTMQLWDYSVIAEASDIGEATDAGEASAGTRGSCCSLEDVHDARRVAETLDIPFYVINLEEAFTREVVDYFTRSYLKGETPNPCVKCNEVMKFELLMRKAMELEADFLATGHYARITKDGNGAFHLLKGVDPGKDQSYFLFTMTQAQLARVLFPLGGYEKTEARELAKGFGLRVHEKEDSQEICFIEGGSYADFVAGGTTAASVIGGTGGTGGTGGAGVIPETGDIIDTNGRVIGTHSGLFRYTVGQRKGLNITTGDGPFYVVALDMKANRLIVGREDELYANGAAIGGVNWIAGHPPEGEGVVVKIRYGHDGAGAKLKVTSNGCVELRFNEPQKAVTPGQAAVFYNNGEDSEVLGGGWILEAI